MIEWLRAAPRDPAIELSGRLLPIELNRHPRAKRLTLRLAPDGRAVRITLPRWCPAKDAIAFAAIRKEWLECQLAKLPRPGDPVGRGWFSYCGERLALDWSSQAPRRPALAAAALRIGGPHETLGQRIRRWLEGEALRLLSEDVAHYCAKAGLPVAPLRLSRAQRRWGSCSSKQMVRINWRLVQAPGEIRRSVVAHEVAHLVHFDHGPRFHTLLGELYEGDIEAANRWLRDHGRGLYADFG